MHLFRIRSRVTIVLALPGGRVPKLALVGHRMNLNLNLYLIYRVYQVFASSITRLLTRSLAC